MTYEPPAKRKARLEAEAYQRAVSADALARQEQAKVERHACPNAEDPDAPPPLIEGQETLA